MWVFAKAAMAPKHFASSNHLGRQYEREGLRYMIWKEKMRNGWRWSKEGENGEKNKEA